MAYFTIYIFYASGVINLIVILGVTALEFIDGIRNLYSKCLLKKTKKAKKAAKKKFREQATTNEK